MDFEEILQLLIKNGQKLAKTLEFYIELVNWTYVGFTIFGILFVWMVIDSMLGTQLSPLFLIVVGIFFVLFFLFTQMIGDML